MPQVHFYFFLSFFSNSNGNFFSCKDQKLSMKKEYAHILNNFKSSLPYCWWIHLLFLHIRLFLQWILCSFGLIKSLWMDHVALLRWMLANLQRTFHHSLKWLHHWILLSIIIWDFSSESLHFGGSKLASFRVYLLLQKQHYDIERAQCTKVRTNNWIKDRDHAGFRQNSKNQYWVYELLSLLHVL